MSEYEDPEAGSRVGRVGFALIKADTLGNQSEDLARSFVPGIEKHHNSRDWILGRTSQRDHYLLGRIGFRRTLRIGMWDPRGGDLVSTRTEDYVIAPFAVDLDDMRAAFQPRGRDISTRSFISAFQALLNAGANKSGEVARWRVVAEHSEEPFDQWLEEVTRIERFKARIQRPNPNYVGRERVEELVEGLRASVAHISARADSDDPDGLNRDDGFLREILDHADRGYGTFDAYGEDAEGNPVEWHSKRSADEMPIPLDPASGEAPAADLIRALEEKNDPPRG
jgi:hypothetical protein